MQASHPSIFRRDLGLNREPRSWTPRGIDYIARRQGWCESVLRPEGATYNRKLDTASRTTRTPETQRANRLSSTTRRPDHDPTMNMDGQWYHQDS